MAKNVWTSRSLRVATRVVIELAREAASAKARVSRLRGNGEEYGHHSPKKTLARNWTQSTFTVVLKRSSAARNLILVVDLQSCLVGCNGYTKLAASARRK